MSDLQYAASGVAGGLLCLIVAAIDWFDVFGFRRVNIRIELWLRLAIGRVVQPLLPKQEGQGGTATELLASKNKEYRMGAVGLALSGLLMIILSIISAFHAT